MPERRHSAEGSSLLPAVSVFAHLKRQHVLISHKTATLIDVQAVEVLAMTNN